MRAKNEELKVALNNKFEALGQNDEDLEAKNKAITKTILEIAVEVGGKPTKQVTSKLSHSTKGLIKNANK